MAAIQQDSSYNVSLPFPLIPNLQLNLHLEKFTKTLNHDSILMIYGPSGIGKTIGILQMADSYRVSSTYILQLNFSDLSEYASENDFLSLVQESLIQSINLIKIKNAQTLKLIVNLFTALASTLSHTIQEFSESKDSAILIQHTIHIFSSISRRIPESPALAIRSLFECIEALSQSLQAIVIIYSLENLAMNEHLKHYGEAIWSVLDSYNGTSRNTSYILEISNPYAYDSTRKGYELYRVPEVQFSDIHVLKEIFTISQLHILYREFGGLPLFYEMAYEYLLSKVPFNRIAEKIHSIFEMKLLRAVYDNANENEIILRKDYLKNFRIRPLSLLDPLMLHFANCGIFGLTNGSLVDFDNNILFSASRRLFP